MTNEQAGEFIKSAYYYMVYGELPTCSFAIEMALAPFVNQWCRDAEKWTAVREKRIEAGAKGGKQKLANASKSKQETLVNVNVNDNVNVNEEREEHAHETFEPNVIYTSPETETEEQRKVAPKKSNYVLLGKDEVVRRIKEDESQTKEYAVFQLNLSNDEFLLSVDMFVGEKGEDGLKRDYGEILKHYRSWLKLNIKIIKNLSQNGNKTQEKYFGIPTDSLKRTHDALLNS